MRISNFFHFVVSLILVVVATTLAQQQTQTQEQQTQEPRNSPIQTESVTEQFGTVQHCAPGCGTEKRGNGVCDDVCNYLPCDWDDGDCCNDSCKVKPCTGPLNCKDPKYTPQGQKLDLLYYDRFTIYLDCVTRSAVQYSYAIGEDVGERATKPKFWYDGNPYLKNCQQTSWKEYFHERCDRSINEGKDNEFCFEQGRLVDAHHVDESYNGIIDANYMTNILPMATGMYSKGGAYHLINNLIECAREISDVKIIGGVIAGTDAKNDYFVGSHGIVTPDSFWKVVVTTNRATGEMDINAWIIPNIHTSRAEILDTFLTNVEEIEKKIGKPIDVPKDLKSKNQEKSWSLTCSEQVLSS